MTSQNTYELERKIHELEMENKTLHNRLNESIKSCREFANLLPQTVYEVSMDGRIEYTNKSGYEMFGYTEEDIKNGLYLKDVVIDEYKDIIYDSLNKIVYGGKKTKGKRYIAKRKNGSTFPVIVYSSQRKEDGVVTGVRGICIDHTLYEDMIEEIKSANEKYKKLSNHYQFILDSIPDMVWTKDIDNVFTFANKAMRERFNKDIDDIIGRKIFDITESVDDAVTSSDELAKSLEVCHFVESVVVNGEEVWLDVVKAPMIDNDKIIGTIGTARDITNKVYNEKLLKSYIEEEIYNWKIEQDKINNRINDAIKRTQYNIKILKERANANK